MGGPDRSDALANETRRTIDRRRRISRGQLAGSKPLRHIEHSGRTTSEGLNPSHASWTPDFSAAEREGSLFRCPNTQALSGPRHLGRQLRGIPPVLLMPWRRSAAPAQKRRCPPAGGSDPFTGRTGWHPPRGTPPFTSYPRHARQGGGPETSGSAHALRDDPDVGRCGTEERTAGVNAARNLGHA